MLLSCFYEHDLELWSSIRSLTLKKAIWRVKKEAALTYTLYFWVLNTQAQVNIVYITYNSYIRTHTERDTNKHTPTHVHSITFSHLCVCSVCERNYSYFLIARWPAVTKPWNSLKGAVWAQFELKALSYDDLTTSIIS